MPACSIRPWADRLARLAGKARRHARRRPPRRHRHRHRARFRNQQFRPVAHHQPELAVLRQFGSRQCPARRRRHGDGHRRLGAAGTKPRDGSGAGGGAGARHCRRSGDGGAGFRHRARDPYQPLRHLCEPVRGDQSRRHPRRGREAQARAQDGRRRAACRSRRTSSRSACSTGEPGVGTHNGASCGVVPRHFEPHQHQDRRPAGASLPRSRSTAVMSTGRRSAFRTRRGNTAT